MSSPAFLEGDGLTLHPVDEDDLAFCRDLANDERVREGLSVATPQTIEGQREFRIEDDDNVSFVVRVPEVDSAEDDASTDGSPWETVRVGVVDLVHISQKFGNAEIGYFFDSDHWSNGYATAAVERVVEYAFNELRLHKVYAHIFSFNDGSRRVLEKVGFEHEGTHVEQAFIDGEYVDTERYGLLRRAWEDDASE